MLITHSTGMSFTNVLCQTPDAKDNVVCTSVHVKSPEKTKRKTNLQWLMVV